MAEGWPREVLDFWFRQEPPCWWLPDPAFDEAVRTRFLDYWEEQRRHDVASFLADADTALAANLLFDQFPRNMFRGHADAFSTDHLALAIAKAGVERGYDEVFEQPRRAFFYMPFVHSEDLEDQQRSLLLFTALGDEEQLRYARKHFEVIERFGRFPTRNAPLGRQPRPEELTAVDADPTKL